MEQPEATKKRNRSKTTAMRVIIEPMSLPQDFTLRTTRIYQIAERRYQEKHERKGQAA